MRAILLLSMLLFVNLEGIDVDFVEADTRSKHFFAKLVGASKETAMWERVIRYIQK